MTSTWELNNKEVTILTKLKIIHKGGVSMQVSVSGQHLSIGSSLQEYVKERVTSSIKKYFDHAPSATVHFNKQNHEFFCDIVVNDGTGRHVVIKVVLPPMMFILLLMQRSVKLKSSLENINLN